MAEDHEAAQHVHADRGPRSGRLRPQSQPALRRIGHQRLAHRAVCRVAGSQPPLHLEVLVALGQWPVLGAAARLVGELSRGQVSELHRALLGGAAGPREHRAEGKSDGIRQAVGPGHPLDGQVGHRLDDMAQRPVQRQQHRRDEGECTGAQQDSNDGVTGRNPAPAPQGPADEPHAGGEDDGTDELDLVVDEVADQDHRGPQGHRQRSRRSSGGRGVPATRGRRPARRRTRRSGSAARSGRGCAG